MNVNSFKKLIKQTVVEAIHEEFPKLLKEALNNNQQIQENKTFSFNSNSIANTQSKDLRNQLAAQMGLNIPVHNSPKLEIIDAVNEDTGEKVNPYLAFLSDSANNMSAQDKNALRNLD